MPSTLDIRRRIRSIKSTRQITKAMELVSAAKMRKTQNAALMTRDYSHLAWDLLGRLAKKSESRLHPLLRPAGPAKRAAVVLITSNRGLIGAFNNNLIGKALEVARNFSNVEFITLGKKGRDAMSKRGYQLAADFPKLDAVTDVLQIRPLAKLITEDFISGKYDKVTMVYADFVSTLVQKPAALDLLPLAAPAQAMTNIDYIFEPDPERVLEILLPRLITMQIYQAVLETNASEHSARMVSMKNASDAAADLVSELTLDFNQIRQAAITKEISEIVAGSLA